MSGVKANWHLADLMPDDTDPMDIRDFAKPIDLNQEAQLRKDLAISLRFEGRLYDQGITCELKSDDGMGCRTCPHRSEDPDVPLTRLCMLSLRQLAIQDDLAIARLGREEAQARAIMEAHGDWAVFEAEAILKAHAEWAAVFAPETVLVAHADWALA